MRKLDLSKGGIVYHQGLKALIENTIGLSSATIKLFETNETKIVPVDELASSLDNNENTMTHLVSFSDEQLKEAKRRLQVITPLLTRNRTIKDVEKVSIEQGINQATLYRWINLYERGCELAVLVPKFSERGGKGKFRIQEETELIINKVIHDLYLHKQKLTPKQIYFDIKRRCTNAGLPIPHENTVRNRIKALSDKHVLKMRESRRHAERLYRNTDGMFPSGNYPLEVVQIDHTPVDLIIVDEKYRQDIGKPYLTLAIDVYSRMIVGFYISLEEPSYFSVSQCISQLILPKEKVLRNHDVEGEWNVWGIPKTIHIDNGAEFRSYDMQKACSNFNISIEWRPVARPQFGGHIERLIGTSMQTVHTLPGTTFSNIQKKGEYNSSKESIMTLTEFENWFCEYVVNMYHKTIHSGIGMTPEKKYEIGIFGDEYTMGRGIPERIEDVERLKLSFLPTEERTIQQTGVAIEKINYYHDVLRKWIKKRDANNKPMKFIFKVDPRDISKIWFYDPELKDFFEIPYRNITYPKMSRWELKKVKQTLAEKNIAGYDESAIFTAYEKMNYIRDKAAEKTKSARKEKERKQIHMRKTNDFLPQGKNKKSMHTNTANASMDDMHKDIQPFDEIDIGE